MKIICHIENIDILKQKLQYAFKTTQWTLPGRFDIIYLLNTVFEKKLAFNRACFLFLLFRTNLFILFLEDLF